MFPLKLKGDSELINYAVVDAFTNEAFKGNPAVVCMLSREAETTWMQQVAYEFNLPMTAFLIKRPEFSAQVTQTVTVQSGQTWRDDTDGCDFNIRWFTPIMEVDLCGHATLASAYLLFASKLVNDNLVRFHSQGSGILTAHKIECFGSNQSEKESFVVEMKFPALSTIEVDTLGTLVLDKTLEGSQVVSVKMTSRNDFLVEVGSAEQVEQIQPNFEEIKKCNARGVIITGCTSEGSKYDIVSRFFAPNVGVDEDHVCGQAHCALAPYWGKKLGKETLIAYQASERGGILHLRVDTSNNLVYLQGEAVIVMSGVLLK